MIGMNNMSDLEWSQYRSGENFGKAVRSLRPWEERSRPRSYKCLKCGNVLATVEYDPLENLFDLCAVCAERSIRRGPRETCSSSFLFTI